MWDDGVARYFFLLSKLMLLLRSFPSLVFVCDAGVASTNVVVGPSYRVVVVIVINVVYDVVYDVVVVATDADVVVVVGGVVVAIGTIVAIVVVSGGGGVVSVVVVVVVVVATTDVDDVVAPVVFPIVVDVGVVVAIVIVAVVVVALVVVRTAVAAGFAAVGDVAVGIVPRRDFVTLAAHAFTTIVFYLLLIVVVASATPIVDAVDAAFHSSTKHGYGAQIARLTGNAAGVVRQPP
jgi:hypothetical protein